MLKILQQWLGEYPGKLFDKSEKCPFLAFFLNEVSRRKAFLKYFHIWCAAPNENCFQEAAGGWSFHNGLVVTLAYPLKHTHPILPFTSLLDNQASELGRPAGVGGSQARGPGIGFGVTAKHSWEMPSDGPIFLVPTPRGPAPGLRPAGGGDPWGS